MDKMDSLDLTHKILLALAIICVLFLPLIVCLGSYQNYKVNDYCENHSLKECYEFCNNEWGFSKDNCLAIVKDKQIRDNTLGELGLK